MKHAVMFVTGSLMAVALSLGVPASAPAAETKKAIADIETDLSKLPEPVRAMRERILEAARTGEVDALRPVLESNELMPSVAFDEIPDPIAFWKKLSENNDGREILAGMIQILNMPYAIEKAGGSDEMYIWPYLDQTDIKELTPAQQVDLYQLVTPAEAKEMRDYGHYIGYRLGIGPDGTWHYFLAGD